MTLDPRRTKRIEQTRDQVYKNVGQPALWRSLLTSSGGTPEFGIENVTTYAVKPVKLLLTVPDLAEIKEPGGVIIEGDLYATVREKPDRRDHYEWQGKIYEIHTEPSPVQFGNAVWWRILIRRSGDIG